MIYQLSKKDETGRPIQTVHCLTTNTWIPFALDNTDYQEYLKWLEEGNTPLPADEISE
jgi:hypothetical protein